MTTRLHLNSLKGILLIALFILLLIKSFGAQAQIYKGFVAGFGTRNSTISSTIAQVDQANLVQAGGQIGLMFGNNVLRSKIGLLGYYSSTGAGAGTTDLYESNGAVNFYPLALIAKKGSLVEPYITGGVSYDQFKFFGYYINQEPGNLNYSQAEAPYLGKIKQLNATFGMGVEVKLTDNHNFIHLFGEARYGRNLSSKSDEAAFDRTNIVNQTHVTVGLTFGMAR